MISIALDIDETISDTKPQWFKIQQERFGNPENLSVEEMIKKYKYGFNVPYWQSEEQNLWREMNQRKESFNYDLPPIQEAQTTLYELKNKIRIEMYLTGRPESMRKVTQRWLNLHNFPKAKVVCRPEELLTEEINRWKARILIENFPKIRGIIDDNEEILESLETLGYKGFVIIYDKQELKYKPKVSFEVHYVNNWSQIKSSITNIKLKD